MTERLERLYERARELPHEARASFVEEACAGDPQAQEELLSLLNAAAPAEHFFAKLGDAVLSPGVVRCAVGDRGPSDGAAPAASFASAASYALSEGAVIGHYRIIGHLGSGGMGVVYRALDTRLEREVALKFLPPNAVARPEAEKRLLVEARAVAALEHPNVCVVHEIGETEDRRPFIAMALCEGETLKQRLIGGALPPEEAIAIATQIARALEAAHSRRIIHRDVKPGNVIITGNGTVKLLDFGLAKSPDLTLTQPGVTPGTIAYMSPEQLGDERVDERSDLWSLGVVLYEMLAGRRPFRGGNDLVAVQAILHGDPEPVRSVQPAVPASAAAIVERLLRKDPGKRYPSAAELLADLTREPTPDAVDPAYGKRGLAAAIHSRRGLVSRLTLYLAGNRTAAATAAAIVLVVLGVSGFMIVRTTGIGPAAKLFSAGTLRENERLLIADFNVRGADSALGPALTMVVRAALEQSTAVSVMSQTALAGALERMQRPSSQQLDLELARELAAREGVKALVHGELVSAGGQFLLTLRLLESESGRTLASFSETAGETRLISTADDLSRRLRSHMGESLKEVRASPPLERVTTPSLEALHKYTAGYYANYAETNFPKAVQLFQEAVALDTAFAMAWRMLATAAGNARMQDLHDSALTAAFRHRNRASPAERDFIIAHYYWGVRRDRARAVTAYEALVRRDFQPAAMIQLAVIYTTRREFARAESLLRTIVDKEPSNAVAHFWLIMTLFNQTRLAGADSAITLARSRFRDDPRFPVFSAASLYHRGEFDAYERALEAFRDSSQPLRSFGYRGAANLALLRGQLTERERLWAEARRSGALGPEPIMSDHFMAAVIDQHVRRQPLEAIKRLDALLELPAEARWRSPFQIAFHVSIEYAIAGRPDRARTMLQRYLEEVSDTAALRLEQPALERAWGWVALAERRYRDATEHFRRAEIAPDGPADDCMSCLPVELARTYDAAGQPDSAIVMFEQAVSALRAEPPFGVGPWPPVLLPLIYERLGHLHESQGNHDRAARYYGQFIDLWKDSDPELHPRVTEASRRLTALRSTGSSAGTR